MDLSAQVSQFAANGQWFSTALCLLDNECSFYWNGDTAVSDEIRFLSGSIEVPVQDADFVFITSQDAQAEFQPESQPEDILSRVKEGTHRDPHLSATLIIAAGGNGSDTALLELKGPGIPPQGRRLQLSMTEAAWIKVRDRQKYEYPCGVDMIFLREDNSLFAISRKAAVTWLM